MSDFTPLSVPGQELTPDPPVSEQDIYTVTPDVEFTLILLAVHDGTDVST